MPHSGYTVSSASIGYMSGNSAITSGNNGVFQLIITPDVGFVVAATDFAIGDPFDATKINSVTFADSQFGAYHPQNFVVVTVTMQATYIVSATETIFIDIDGKADGIVSHSNVDVCLKEQVQLEGNCPLSYWPASGSPISPGMVDPPGTNCLSSFVETEIGSGVTQTNLANNTNWPNPLLNLPQFSGSTGIDSAEVNQYQAVHNPISPGTPTTLFTKIFWTGPGRDFSVVPFYELNALAAASGDYIIEESQNNYNVDKTLISAVTNNHIITIDTTDILPGMQVTGSTLTTCSYDPNTNPTPANLCYPSFGMDIRVTKVDAASNKVHLTEAISSLAVGDVLNFSTISFSDMGNGFISGGNVVCKKFVVKYNGSSDVSCGDHVINWAQASGSTVLSGLSQPKIIATSIPTGDLIGNGDVRRLRIQGTKGLATFSVNIYSQSDNTSYDFNENKFTVGASDLIDQTVGENGQYVKDIIFPFSSVDNTYTITITPKTVKDKSYLSTVVDSGVLTSFEIKQFVTKTLTFTTDATTTGLTLASGLTNSISMSSQPGVLRNINTPTWSGNITKADGSVLYVNRNPLALKNNGIDTGDFNFNTTSTTDGQSNSTNLTLSPTITGAGTTTITATITGNLISMGTKNTTVTFDVDNFITVRPSVPDVGGGRSTKGETGVEIITNVESGKGGNPKEGASDTITISLSSEDQFVDIDLRSFDNDTNASSKTLSTVTDPEKGSLSGFGGSGSAYDAGKVRYVRNEDVIIRPGGIDQFIYKATVGGLDSDTDGQGTVTITFIE